MVSENTIGIDHSRYWERYWRISWAVRRSTQTILRRCEQHTYAYHGNCFDFSIDVWIAAIARHMPIYIIMRLPNIICLSLYSLSRFRCHVTRIGVCRVDEEWRMPRKLGSLLGEAEDVARRKQLANVAFRKLSTVWFRRSRISPPLRQRLYDSFVVPVLNMATWGLTKANSNAWTHTTVAIYARSPAFTGRIASRTRRYIAAVDVAPSAKT